MDAFDLFSNFNNSSSKFETSWPSGQPAANHKPSPFSDSNDAFDPFAPVQKLSPVNQFFDAIDDDQRRKEKQIKDDYEFALRLQKESSFQKRKF